MTLFVDKHPVVATFVAVAALVLCYPIILLINRLLHRKRAALKIEDGKLVVAVGFDEKAVDLSKIKSVSLLRPTSEQIGKTLHIEMHGAYEGNQWRLRTLSVPLALLSVQGRELVRDISLSIANAQTPNQSFQRTASGGR